MYKKLNTNVTNLDLNNLKGTMRPFIHDTFWEFEIKDLNYLKTALGEQLTFLIPPDRINVTEILSPGAAPHVDAWSVGLNYYFDAGDEITYYYDEYTPMAQKSKFTDYKISAFDPDNLKIVDSFTANKGDWYLLNTKKIHSVDVSKQSRVRTMLRFIWWNADFQDVCDSIKIN